MTVQVDTDEMRAAGLRANYYKTGEGPLWNTAADEIDRLQKVIEDAPHEWTCPARQGEHLKCLCWKADAL